MRIVVSVLVVMALISFQGLQAAPAKSSTQGVLTSVSGTVQVQSKDGQKTHNAKDGSTVSEGEVIQANQGSSATLRLFDGSELKISPNTKVRLAQMKKPSVQDKVLKFKLLFGQLLANVKKLATAKSSFEIEAGGVVCGVRGTQYDYSYDPNNKVVKVHVMDGTVYLNSNGHTYLFTAGQTGIFTNGQPNKGNNSGPSSDKGKGKVGNLGGAKGGNLSLADLNQQFKGGITVNPGGSTDNNPITGGKDNGLTNPNVGGAIDILIHANVPLVEAVP